MVLASSETTAQQQHIAVNGSKYKTAIKKPQIMLRTAPNFSNIRNRVPAHISRHQTFDIVAVFVGKYEQNSPPEKPSLSWGSPVSRLPSAVESCSNDHHWAVELYCTRLWTHRASPQQVRASRVVSFVDLFWQIRQWYQMFDASKYALGPYF